MADTARPFVHRELQEQRVDTNASLRQPNMTGSQNGSVLRCCEGGRHESWPLAIEDNVGLKKRDVLGDMMGTSPNSCGRKAIEAAS
jgi:hypothetical protein